MKYYILFRAHKPFPQRLVPAYNVGRKPERPITKSSVDRGTEEHFHTGSESNIIWHIFHTAREIECVMGLKTPENIIQSRYTTYIYIILLHCYASTFRPSARHDSIYTVIKPIVSFRILTIAPTYRVRPRHLFFASPRYRKTTCSLPFGSGDAVGSVSQAVRVSLYVHAQRLPAAAQCDLQEYAAAAAAPRHTTSTCVRVWTTRPGCCIGYKA